MSRFRLLSREHLGRDLRTAAVALIVSSVVMATPSVAARITDADTVDGKDAVGAAASPAKRAGKLVATNRGGRLPDNIIDKARDADRIDGLDSSALVPAKLRPGHVQTGTWGVFGGPSGSFMGHAVTFRSKLPHVIAQGRYTLIRSSDPSFTANCPGPGQVTVDAWLCIYETYSSNATLENVSDPSALAAPVPTAGLDGFFINFIAGNTAAFSFGTYAVRAGDGTEALREVEGRRPSVTSPAG